MFEQIKNLAGREFYLISSLIIFLFFFILVSIYLVKLNKNHIRMMSKLPLTDNDTEHEED
ncbi:hypothetical protein QWY86_05045 [Pedobacter aquatilis]|uniref:hypothetical protein n=1 Tax=Pedobacter aquatilis TaxID=351343 RepID=UPI0025B3C015|nr:hypothetical protein [Pedobacter aquatilis]MDN3586022.1 hypothetical protein [Pedobacter aquatilis]